MAKLKIRKDRTSTVLRKLASLSRTPASPGACLDRHALDGMSRAEAASAPAWTGRRSGTGSSATTRTVSPALGQLERRPSADADARRAGRAAGHRHGRPDPEKDGFCAFTRDDLVAIAEKKFGKSMHPASMGRVLRRLYLSRRKRGRHTR